MIALFGLDGISARALQKHYYRVYGTTLAGLIREYDVAPAEFLHFVHDIDRSSLKPNPPLAQAIEALPGRKLILTNGSHAHALATSRQLGIDHLFEDFFAIEHADYLPKPALQTFQRFFERHSVDPARSAMFEDIVHNLEAPHASGMLTVLVSPKQRRRPPRRVGKEPPDSAACRFRDAGFDGVFAATRRCKSWLELRELNRPDNCVFRLEGDFPMDITIRIQAEPRRPKVARPSLRTLWVGPIRPLA